MLLNLMMKDEEILQAEHHEAVVFIKAAIKRKTVFNMLSKISKSKSKGFPTHHYRALMGYVDCEAIRERWFLDLPEVKKALTFIKQYRAIPKEWEL